MNALNYVRVRTFCLMILLPISGCQVLPLNLGEAPTPPGQAATVVVGSIGEPSEILPTESALPTPFLPTPFPDQNQALHYDRPQYSIDARLDFETHVLDINQVVIYTNRTGEPLSEILMLVDANWTEGVFFLESLNWSDGAPVEAWFLEGGFLTIRFPEALMPERTASFDLHYLLQLPAERGKLGYSPNQLNLGDWYPMTAVYRPGSGWLAYPPNPVGETMVYESADYRVRIEMNNAPEGLVVAASLPVQRDDQVYLYSGEALRNFALSMSSSYEVLRDQVGDVEVASYFFAQDRIAGKAALDSAAQAIEVFTDLFGPYPHAVYSVVSGNFPDGLEFDGLAFTGLEYYAWYDGTDQNYLTLITIHEAAHQWWFAQIGSDQALEPWVDEALSIYSEYLFIETVKPELRSWWWEFRLDPFRPLEGSVNGPVFAHRSYRPYVNAVYLRGAEMMHAVREEIGRDIFLEALRAYLADYRTQHANGQNLIDLFESSSEKRLDTLLEVYLSFPQ